MPTWTNDDRARVARELSAESEHVMASCQPVPTQEELDNLIGKGIHPPDDAKHPVAAMPPLSEQYARLNGEGRGRSARETDHAAEHHEREPERKPPEPTRTSSSTTHR